MHYLDADAAQQRMQMSVDNGWLGVSLFAFSYEDDAVWDRIAEINATLETVPADSAAPTTAAPASSTVPATTAAPTTTAAAPTTVAATTPTPPSTTAAATTTTA